MTISSVNYNPYLYTGIKATNNSYRNAVTKEPSIFTTTVSNINDKDDIFESVQTLQSTDNNSASTSELKKRN